MSSAASSLPLPMIEIPSEHKRGIGVLTVEQASKRVALPLAEVKINAKVADRIAFVTMTEKFRNTYQEHLEAVYIFPLPGGAAVSDFIMQVGNRRIRGKVDERGEARRQYQQAIEDGKRAAIMEKEREDLFTVQVGNIPPGEEITIEISYSERLPFFENGTTEMRLPLVVAPRYIPGTPLDRDAVGDGVEMDTDAVPDASRITPPRLAKGFDAKVSLNLEVELLLKRINGAAVDINDLCCSQHATRTGVNSNSIRVSLARADEALNRDFVLRWSLAGDEVQPTLLIHRDPAGKPYGMLSLVPPKMDRGAMPARDVLFVLDRSGSMGGVKMTSAARACSILLNTLRPHDRFAIQAFDDRTEWLEPNHKANALDYFLDADEGNIELGDKYLRSIDSRGGTEIHAALLYALKVINARKEKNNRIPVIVFLTDGQIGDESRVLKEIQQNLGDIRAFTIGIDTAVNSGFLRRLAELGRGTATFVVPGAQLETALCEVGREIGAPLVTDITIEDIDAGVDINSIAPSRITDLFVGRATTAFFDVKQSGRIRVKGKLATGGQFVAEVTAEEVSLPAIPQLWAKTRITDLEDQFRLEPARQHDLKLKIIELSKHHSILTRFTAFVVVDEAEIVNKGGDLRKVVQPVEMPADWEMDDATVAGAPSILVNPAPMRQSAPIPTRSARSRQAPNMLDKMKKEDARTLSMGPVPDSMPPPPAPSSPPASKARAEKPAELFLSIPEPLCEQAESSDSFSNSGHASEAGAPAKQPPVREQAPAAQGSSDGLLSRVVDAVTGFFRRDANTNADAGQEEAVPPDDDIYAQEQEKEPVNTVPDIAKTGGKIPPPVKPESTAAITLSAADIAVLQDLYNTFAASFNDIFAERQTDGHKLEQLRNQALNILRANNSNNIFQALIDFLENGAVEFIKVAKDFHTRTTLMKTMGQDLAKQHKESFDTALAAVKNHLPITISQNSSSSGGGSNFWDSSI